MTKKGRFKNYRTNQILPKNHQWVPVSEWKIAQVTPTSRPLSRVQHCIFAMRQKRTDYRLAAIDYEHPEDSKVSPSHPSVKSTHKIAPKLRLRRPITPRANARQKKEKKPADEQTPLHPASLSLIENLQHRFLTLFLSLSPTDQQALLENFLVHNFGVWNFGTEDQLSPLGTDDTPLGETQHEAFQALMQRLGRLASLEQKKPDHSLPLSAPLFASEDDDFEDVFDNIFSNQDPLNTPEQQQVMRKFLEASIATILVLKSNNH